MNNAKISWITRTALLIAIVVVAQFLGSYIPGSQILIGPIKLSQLITGSLVNLTLVVAAAFTGLGSGITVGIVSSVLATLIGVNLPLPQMIPVVAIGNAIIVAVAWAFFRMADKKGNSSLLKVIGIVVAAAAKTAFLWVAVVAIVIPVFQPAAKIASLISLNFTWPQMITGVIGGLIALSVVPPLKKAIRK